MPYTRKDSPPSLGGTPRLAVILCATLALSCLYGKKQKQQSGLDDRSRRFVLIDARRLPEAVVQRVGLRNLQPPAPADIDEMREALCGGLEDRLIFYQLVVSRHWHYYWLCSQDDAVRAMTPDGDRMLRAWLVHMQRRTLKLQRRCPASSTRRMFSERHASGTTGRAYCDGVVMLFFPDGGEKSFEAHRGPLTATVRQPGSPRREPKLPGPPPGTAPAAGRQSCAEPNTTAACREFGQKAFWQGVQRACSRICPAIFRRCRKLAPGNALCHQLSEHCATLKGVCVK
jgi:hypothetical protein